VRNIFIFNETWAQDKIYFSRQVEIFYLSLTIGTGTGPNFKQHVLSQPEVRKLSYSLAELYVKCSLFEFIRVQGGASYKSLGITRVRNRVDGAFGGVCPVGVDGD
jgi:hypothetical protein